MRSRRSSVCWFSEIVVWVAEVPVGDQVSEEHAGDPERDLEFRGHLRNGRGVAQQLDDPARHVAAGQVFARADGCSSSVASMGSSTTACVRPAVRM